MTDRVTRISKHFLFLSNPAPDVLLTVGVLCQTLNDLRTELGVLFTHFGFYFELRFVWVDYSADIPFWRSINQNRTKYSNKILNGFWHGNWIAGQLAASINTSQDFETNLINLLDSQRELDKLESSGRFEMNFFGEHWAHLICGLQLLSGTSLVAVEKL